MSNDSKYLQYYKKEHYDQINVFAEGFLKNLAKKRARELNLSLSQYVTSIVMEDLEGNILEKVPDGNNREYTGRKFEQINVLTPKGLRLQSKRRAKELNRSLSQYIRDLIKSDASRHGTPSEHLE